MYMHPHIAYEMSRTRQEELRQRAIRHATQASDRGRERSATRLRSRSLKPVFRWVPAR